MKVTEIEAEILNPEFGNKGDRRSHTFGERTVLKIKQSIVSLVEAGKKIT